MDTAYIDIKGPGFKPQQEHKKKSEIGSCAQ